MNMYIYMIELYIKLNHLVVYHKLKYHCKLTILHIL